MIARITSRVILRIILGLIASMFILAAANGCTRFGKQGVNSGGSNISSVGINLPSKDQFRQELRDKLNGYRVIIEPKIDGCNGATVTDVVGTWDQAQLTQSLVQGCDYSIGMEAGELDAAKTKLQTVYFSNWTGPKQGQAVTKESFQGQAKIDVKLNLTVTAAGAAAGFNEGLPPGVQPIEPNVPPTGSNPATGIGTKVELGSFAAVNNDTSAPAGTVLRDIVTHIPADQIATYKDGDLITWGHETSHGIHAYIRNTKNTTGTKANGFYVLDGKYALVKEPNIRLSAIGPFIPQNVRESRYQLYLVQQAAQWDDTPLYVFDEWNAYVNGGAVGIDMVKQNKWTETSGRDGVMGSLEFSIYAIAVGMAVKSGDPAYFSSNQQFKEFLAFNLRRAMQVFQEGRTMKAFQGFGQDELFEKFKTSAETEAMRQFSRETFGDVFCKEVLGL